MTNINKINGLQKGLMSEFMLDHPNLAKNLLPNCSQGKAMSHRLWEQLGKKLNAAGPPIKDAKIWRKVFADQKHNVKKKLSFNKASKKQTGGGPHEEKLLTAAEEQLLEATGMDVAVEGLSVESFGNVLHTKKRTAIEPETTDQPDPVAESLRNLLTSEDEVSDDSSDFRAAPKEANTDLQKGAIRKRKYQSQTESKLSLLKTNIHAFEESQATIICKLDKLIELKERSLAIREEEHEANMAVKKVELEILNIKLNMLKKQ